MIVGAGGAGMTAALTAAEKGADVIILESQAAVPLSIPVETFLMLFMFNLINEAGTRVPGVVGTSLGTVSGLIL